MYMPACTSPSYADGSWIVLITAILFVNYWMKHTLGNRLALVGREGAAGLQSCAQPSAGCRTVRRWRSQSPVVRDGENECELKEQ
jgi:hypothetical protein